MLLPAVSVIVPAYQTTAYITQALDCLRAQTFRDFETIVVNDGCPDTAALEAVLRPYRDEIRYYCVDNGGPGSARNYAIRQSQAPLVAMLDSDDLWTPDYLAVQTRYLAEHPDTDVVYSNAIFFGDTADAGRLYMDLYPSEGEVDFASVLTRRVNILAFVTARRQTLLDAGLYDTRFPVGEDFELWLRILKQGGRIAYHREPLVHYRRRRGSQTAQNLVSMQKLLPVYEKIRDTYSLTTEERQLLQREITLLQANLAREQGRLAVLAGDFPLARQSWGKAWRPLGEYRLLAAWLMLWVTPGRVQQLLKGRLKTDAQ